MNAPRQRQQAAAGAAGRRPARGTPLSRAAGFTLIEVVLAAGLIALLVGGIYAVARGAFRIGNDVVANQQRSTLVSSFVELCRRTFEEMPGNAQLELASSNVGTFTTELIFTDYPLAFTWSGVPAGASQVILMSEKTTRGDLQVKVQYLTAEEAEARGGRLSAGEVGASLVLLQNVGLLQWRFYDSRTETWETEWAEPTRRPSLIEMTLEIYGEEPVRSVFWIPSVANPETLAQGFQGSQPAVGGGAGGGAGAGAGAGAGQPDFDLPTDPEARRRALAELRRRRGGGGGGGGGGDSGGGRPPGGGGPPPGGR